MNVLLNDNATILRQKVSDARNSSVLSDEGTVKLTKVLATLSALSTLVEPLRETCKFADVMTEEIADELSDCIAFGEDLFAIQWSPTTSYGLHLFLALENLAMAEALAHRSGLDITFDDLEFEVTIQPSDCECDEPCSEVFDLLDESSELLAFILEWNDLELQCVASTGERQEQRGSGGLSTSRSGHAVRNGRPEPRPTTLTKGRWFV